MSVGRGGAGWRAVRGPSRRRCTLLALGAGSTPAVSWKGWCGTGEIVSGPPMSQAADYWYVRFPDGRMVRASSTASVRRRLRSGRIPRGSRVRRSPDQEWLALGQAAEFADLVEHLPPEETT